MEYQLLIDLKKYLYHKPGCREVKKCLCGLDDLTDKLEWERIKYCREKDE